MKIPSAMAILVGQILDVPACLVGDDFIVNLAIAVKEQQIVVKEAKDSAKIEIRIAVVCTVVGIVLNIVFMFYLNYIWRCN